MQRLIAALFRLTRREYFADFFITTPPTVVLLVVSLKQAWTPLWWPAGFACGLLAWSFYEYAVHRWLLHKVWLLRDMHDLHHADQKDYIALHPAGTAALYVTLWLVFGAQSSPLMVGFSVGYLIYSVAHTAFHYTTITPLNVSWLYEAKRRHALHHRFDDVNFGVTTPAWDYVFGTLRT